MKLPRYILKWRPVPRRPWVILDTETGNYARDKEGKAFTFDEPLKACAKAEKLEKLKPKDRP